MLTDEIQVFPKIHHYKIVSHVIHSVVVNIRIHLLNKKL